MDKRATRSQIGTDKEGPGRNTRLQQAERRRLAEERERSEAGPSRNTRSNKRERLDGEEDEESGQLLTGPDIVRKVRDLASVILAPQGEASALDGLKNRYLLVGDNNLPPTFEDSKITFIIDGKKYFQCVDELIRSARQGDAVYITGRYFESDMDLQGRSKGDANHYPIDRL